MSAVSVRYIVDDVDAATRFYTERLGFHRRTASRARFRHARTR
jgi:catechol 2,3-dioxygenase-like lactoylglutathione lyase family enzyme